jgi:hypothetical protein
MFFVIEPNSVLARSYRVWAIQRRDAVTRNSSTRPLTAVFPSPITPLAWDDDSPIEVVEGIAYLASKSCSKLRTWAKQLRGLHKLDKSHETDVRFSPLSASPLRESELKKLGVSNLVIYGCDDREVRTAQAGKWVFRSVPLMTVVVDKADGDAVGFVSFRLQWSMEAEHQPANGVRLEVELDQAWITPPCRSKGWGDLAALAIAVAACNHAEHVERSPRWPARFGMPLEVVVGADVYSTSGEALLKRCARYISLQLSCSENLKRLVLQAVRCECRW